MYSLSTLAKSAKALATTDMLKSANLEWLNQFSANWFDLVVLAVLGFGIFRGRKRGMSEEMLDVFQWLIIVVGSAFLYQPLGKFVASFTSVGLLPSYICSYLFVALVFKLVFTMIKRMVGEKMVGSDIFGRAEYYLGMGAGMLRYACLIMVFLALLNAKYISDAELKRMAKVQQDNFGTITFPTFGTTQEFVFKESFTGSQIKKYLPHLLIVPTGSGEGKQGRENIGQRRAREVDDVMKPRN